MAFVAALYTWTVFLILFINAWDAAVQRSLVRLDLDLAHHPAGLRRPYYIALVAFTLAGAAFEMVASYVAVYAACVIIVLTAPNVSNKLWTEYMVELMGRPEVALGAVAKERVGLHAALLLLALLFGALSVGFYMTDDDLARPRDARTKAVRLLFIVPTIMLVAYLLYIALQLFSQSD
jgi:hypothetical protein